MVLVITYLLAFAVATYAVHKALGMLLTGFEQVCGGLILTPAILGLTLQLFEVAKDQVVFPNLASLASGFLPSVGLAVLGLAALLVRGLAKLMFRAPDAEAKDVERDPARPQ